MTRLLGLILAATGMRIAASGHPPAVCEGWPAPSSAVISATNYTNPDLPDLRTFLNGTKV